MTAAIPPGVQELFWDAGETIDPERNADYVLGRVLEHGRHEDVRWLLGYYGAERILDFVRRRGPQVLSPATANFWLMALGGEHWDESYQSRKSPLWPH
ncbi:MAG: DUF6922 domain-containing protein [Myxococcota bacterium]